MNKDASAGIHDDKEHVMRDPVHGLIPLYPWEKKLIDTPAFQRLKRIHQLGMTHYVYPGAEHTRFTHSLGVMHVASRMFDQLAKYEPLKRKPKEELTMMRNAVRISALLHDIGHGCYSHVGEKTIFPKVSVSKSPEVGHEAYTKLIILSEQISDILSKYKEVTGGVTAKDIVRILNGDIDEWDCRFQCDILSGALDADKMDYLLRDSRFCGVTYGLFDLERLLYSLRLVEINKDDTRVLVLGITKHGIQAVEEFVMARYWMFIQVYFHKYRRLYDHYLTEFLKLYLKKHFGEENPTYPTKLDEYLKLDDCVLLAEIHEAWHTRTFKTQEGRMMQYYASKLMERNHHKVAFDPPLQHIPRRVAASSNEDNGKANNFGKVEYNTNSLDVPSDYLRVRYVYKKIREFIKTLPKESERQCYRYDYAKGGAIKEYFNVSAYDEKFDADIGYSKSGDPEPPPKQRVPSIPVLTGDPAHPVRPIQHFSIVLDAVSDRVFSMLRVYCDESLVDETTVKCHTYITEYDDYTMRERLALKAEEQAGIAAAQRRETKDKEFTDDDDDD